MLHLKAFHNHRPLILILMIAICALSAAPATGVDAQTGGKGGQLGPADPSAITHGESITSCLVPFGDVPTSAYFFDSVRYLYCLGAIGGYSDNTFRPGNTNTRAQFSKVLVLLMGWPVLNPPNATFNDVPVGSTFFSYIETAVAHGIVNGYGDGSFHPGDSITRGQLVKMTVLAQGWPVLNPPTATFNDVPVGSSSYGWVETAYAHGVIEGYPDGSFRPGNSTTRAQVSKVIYYANTEALTPEEQQTIDIINSRRADLGLVTLHADPALHRAARRHSVDIGPLSLCQHDGTDGSSPWDRAAQAGYTGFAMGEVVGCNYATPLAVVDGWWASQGHHDVLVDPSARDIGCGWWINAQGYGWQTCLTGAP
ncbi:MAG TPA: S-layer homology domain-containing protein [Chloroflexia bacterium]|nr:S-layer homology domain-containing protein [Chloroflexia bacterium]